MFSGFLDVCGAEGESLDEKAVIFSEFCGYFAIGAANMDYDAAGYACFAEDILSGMVWYALGVRGGGAEQYAYNKV